MKSSITAIAMLSATGIVSAQDVLPTPPESSIEVRLTPVASGLSTVIDGVPQLFATDFAPIPDGSGRVLVMTLGGVVRVLDTEDGLLPEPFLLIPGDDTQIEPSNFGMTSIAIHPSYAQKGSPGYGKFYTIETERADAGVADFAGSLDPLAFGGQHQDVVYEYTADDIGADTFSGSKRELLRVLQPGWDHNLFDLAFGIGSDADHMYISSGDGANAGESDAVIRDNAQFLGNVFGTILRIDPLGNNSENGAYGIPPNNPFVGNPDALPEIYSYGHRSPYRLSVDTENGTLWLGEVGQRQIEEVNTIHAGANYGWPLKEGSFLFDEFDHLNARPDPDLDMNGTGDFADDNGLSDPVFELDHDTSISITGGFVYRGNAIPHLRNQYLFADAVLPGIYAGPADATPVANETGQLARLRIDPKGAPAPPGVISIGQDMNGELYLLTIDGRILRVDPSPCGPADLFPDGSLDFFDITAFLTAFNDEDAAADFDANGRFDFFDITAFIQQFNLGCP